MKKLWLILGFIALFSGDLASSQLFGTDVRFLLNKANPAEMSVPIEDALRAYESALTRVQSAPQSSQVSNEINTYMQFAIIRQNEEIIRLLKKIAKE